MPLAAMNAAEIQEFLTKVDSDLLQSLLRNDVSEHVIACLSKAYGNHSHTIWVETVINKFGAFLV
jgi:hypothetical protein